jgi:hypothetical protein
LKLRKLTKTDEDMNKILSLNNRLTSGRNTKWTSENPQENTFFNNYGTMLDFFDYSGARV